MFLRFRGIGLLRIPSFPRIRRGRTALLSLAGIVVLSGSAHGQSSKDLWKTMVKDSGGLYLTHIPGVFSVHAARTGTGIAYSGTIRDPGGWVHVTRNHDPGREMVLERVSPDTLRFLIAPSNAHRPVGFSFETRTGCFTLRARQTPEGTLPILHLNGYAPPVKAFPAVFCGNGTHLRVEWQGSLPRSKSTHPTLSRRRSPQNAP